MSSSDVADPKASVADYVCRMLAELRASGTGVFIVDQLPTKVAPDVIKSTNAKIFFRQVAKEDREELGGATCLDPVETEELSRLKPGEAFFYTEGYHKPRKIKAVDLSRDFDLDTLVINENILDYLQDDPWYVKVMVERTVAELMQLREKMDSFDKERLQIVRKLSELLAQYPLFLSQLGENDKTKRFKELIKTSHRLKQNLSASYKSFLRHSYKRYLPSNAIFKILEPDIKDLRNDLVNRFESVTKAGVRDVLKMIDTFIGRCGAAED